MSVNRTLARPYARAAFEMARGADALAGWHERLAFSAALAATPQFRAVHGNPRIGEGAVVALLLPESEPADSAYASFLRTLAANRRVALLPEMADLFGELRREHERVVKVTVRTATPLEASTADAMRVALERRFGRKVELDSTIDPSIIGGAVIDAGDVVIDGSVRGRLARLQQALAQ
jgi:F-type H+-transporting ATPase subunit delta